MVASGTTDTVFSLRPRTLDEYIGQEPVKKTVKFIIEASIVKETVLPHMLMQGPAGHGKTSLVNVLAKTRGVELTTLLAPSISTTEELTTAIVAGSAGRIVFIDEIHRLRPKQQEAIYSAMEDFKIETVVGSGRYAYKQETRLLPFSLMGATTNPGMLSKPLLDRFRVTHRLSTYTLDELKILVKQSAKRLHLTIDDEAIESVAQRCRFNPRQANNLLMLSHDMSVVLNGNSDEAAVNLKVVNETLESLGIDVKGLTPDDRQLLKTIANTFSGGPVGVDSLASTTDLDKANIIENIEPVLLRYELITRGLKGRSITKLGLEHLILTGEG
tara:strand:- start:6208 stop:7194 length:987 start_codon:yes stop_codon:yes gene_type:complete